MMKVLRLLPWLGIKSTADLTTARFANYIAGRKALVSTKTIIGELGYLKAACELAVEEGWLAKNPLKTRRLALRREPKQGKSHHSIVEVGRVLDHLERASPLSRLDHRLYALAATVAYTGIRRSEAIYLDRGDIDLNRRMVRIFPKRGHLKTEGSAAPLPVARELLPILAKWLDVPGPAWVFPGNAWKNPWMSGHRSTRPVELLRKAGEAVGVFDLTFQSLRHSWATHAESAWGLTEEQIRRMLRHTNSFTQAWYRWPDEDNLLRLVETVSYRKSG